MNLKLLIVDDEAEIVRSLAKLLRRARPMWEIQTTTSSAEALALLDSPSRYDAIVSDMRMPLMGGAELLEQVAARSPRTARIVMSGHAVLDAPENVAPFAHEALGKPCTRDEIIESIERVIATLRAA